VCRALGPMTHHPATPKHHVQASVPPTHVMKVTQQPTQYNIQHLLPIFVNAVFQMNPELVILSPQPPRSRPGNHVGILNYLKRVQTTQPTKTLQYPVLYIAQISDRLSTP